MWRRTVLALGLAVVTAAAASAVPFGSFGGLVTGGNAATGVVGVHGWALDASGVAYVDIYVDGRIAGRADYGKGRPEVTRIHPGFPDSALPGFGFLLDTTHYLNGLHSVSARITANDGSQTWLQQRNVEFMNATHLLKPFGMITFPETHAELRGACDLADPSRRYSVIEGYALDAGVERGDGGGPPRQGDPPGDSGVGYVELLIDGAIYANSRRDCFFSHATGGLTNCYGVPSLDIERLYPTLPDAPHARFRFVLDIGVLIDLDDLGFPTRYALGQHVLTVRVGDIAGQVANIDEMVVTFACDEFLGNEPSFGVISMPPNGPIYSGVVQAHGWALDWEGVARVEVYGNGELFGVATYGISRPGVGVRYPGFPNSGGPGWTFQFDTTRLPDGWNDMQVVVVDVHGEETIIGEETIFINNAAP